MITIPSISYPSSPRLASQAAHASATSSIDSSALGVRVRAEAERTEPGERLPLRRRRRVAVHADPVDVDRERPRRRDRGVELAQRACGRVARVRRRLAAGGELRLVEAVEAGEREVDLAAHLEHVGLAWPSCLEEAQRHGLERAQVPRHVLASQPVSTRRAAHVDAVLVDERDGRAVDLRLEHVGDGVRHCRAAFARRPPISRAPRPSSPSRASPSETGARPCESRPPAERRRAASESRA